MYVLIVVIGVLNFGLGYVLAAAFGFGPPGWYLLQQLVSGRARLPGAMLPTGGGNKASPS